MQARAALQLMRDTLAARLQDVPSFAVEDNDLCISAHYRRVPPELHAHVAETVKSCLQEVHSARAASARALAEHVALPGEAFDTMSIGSACGFAAALGTPPAQCEEDADAEDARADGLLGPPSEVRWCPERPLSPEHEPLLEAPGASPAATPSTGPLSTDTLKMHEGKMVLEIKPRVDWHKGRAIEWLYARARSRMLPERRDLVPIFIGDDLADEDGFDAVQRIHPAGIAIKVTAPDVHGPSTSTTRANFRLETVSEVHELLRFLAGRPA